MLTEYTKAVPSKHQRALVNFIDYMVNDLGCDKVELSFDVEKNSICFACFLNDVCRIEYLDASTYFSLAMPFYHLATWSISIYNNLTGSMDGIDMYEKNFDTYGVKEE